MSIAIDMDEDLYIPQMGRIVDIADVTPKEKYFRVELERPLNHRPGQFVMVSIPGAGESAISITCGPRDDNILEMVIRKAGNVTGILHTLEVGQFVGIRGPFGNGFDMEEFYGKDILFVAGGLGLVPLRSLITPVMQEAERFGNVHLIVGSRTPSESMFRDELHEWNEKPNVNLVELVDKTEHQPWNARVGLVTQPIGEIALDADKTLVVLCGPPVMYKFVIMELALHHSIPDSQIFVDLERRMKCGVGKCGHCQINQVYCCQEGPVFRYSDVMAYPEAFV